MTPITLPTSPERQTALENKGWSVVATPPYETWDCGSVQVILSADGDHRLTDLQGLSKPGVLSRLLEFAAILGIAPKGYRIILEQAEATPLFDWSFSGARLLSPHPSEEGGPSPSPLAAIDDKTAALMSEVLDHEPGFHQVNPINQRKAGAMSADPLILLEVLYNCAVNDSRLSPEVERQIRRVLGVDNVVGPGEEETP